MRVNGSGTFSAGNVIMSGTSRLEAAGTNYVTTVGTTLIGGGSTLAVGTAGGSTGESLTLASTVVTNSNAIVELSIFGDGDNDSIVMGTGSALNLDADTVFKLVLEGAYVPGTPQSWTMFSGLTANISGGFDPGNAVLPTLPSGWNWDLGDFNETGGWQVSVVPEPGSVLLLVGGLVMLLARRQCRS